MTRFIPILILFTSLNLNAQNDSIFVRQIFDEALENGQSYENLKVLCKSIGARISGSKQAEDAIRWGRHLLKSFNLDTVYLQEIQIPN